MRSHLTALLPLLALLLAVGCDRYDPDGILLRPGCVTQRVQRLVPADGAPAVFVGTILLGDLACIAPEASLELRSQGGALVDAVLTRHRGQRQLRLRPRAPLIPNQRYEARLDTDDGHRTWAFTTSAAGSAVGSDAVDATAAADGDGALLLDPAVGATALDGQLVALRPALQLLSGPADAPDLLRLGAWTGAPSDGVQDGSHPTLDLAVSWDDPFFETAPSDLRWRLVDLPLVLEDAVISGAVQPGGAGIEGIAIRGLWDTREATPALGELCQADLDALGDGCRPCRDGEASCLAFELMVLRSEPWPGTLTPIF